MIEKIITSPENILPKSGLWGYVLENWLVLAVAVMALGFVIDQVFFIVRFRPQDKWKAIWNRLCGRPQTEDEEPEANPLCDSGITVHKTEQKTVNKPPERPVQRPVEKPAAADEPVYRAPVRPKNTFNSDLERITPETRFSFEREEKTVYKTPVKVMEEKTVYHAPVDALTVSATPKKDLPGHLPHKTMEKPENIVTDRLHRPVQNLQYGDEPVIVRGRYDPDKYLKAQDDFDPEKDAPVIVRAVKVPEQEPTTQRP